MGDFQHATFDYLQVSRVCTSASSSWVPAGTFPCEPHGSFTQQTAKDELRLHVICYILWSKNMIGWYDWLIYIYISRTISEKKCQALFIQCQAAPCWSGFLGLCQSSQLGFIYGLNDVLFKFGPPMFQHHMAVCQNLIPLVNPKIAGKWMFIPLKMYL